MPDANRKHGTCGGLSLSVRALALAVALAACGRDDAPASKEAAVFGGALGNEEAAVFALGNPSANLDQCANGPLAAPALCAWVNGNLNENQAHYLEGESIPYRLRFENLGTGSTIHSVEIEWDTTVLEGGASHHALDHLTTFDATEPAYPCTGVPGCLPPGRTYPIPLDADVLAGPDGLIGTSDDIFQVPGSFTLYGGEITSVGAYELTGSYTGSSRKSVTLSFTASVANPVLAWGGHIALRSDWAPLLTAVHIPGSPYHTRLLDLDGSGGNQDRSLSAAAIHTPPEVIVVKHVVNEHGGTAVAADFTMTVTATNPSPASFPGAESPGTPVALGPGSYSVGEFGLPGYEASYSADCTGVAEVDQTRTCTVTNTQVDVCLGVTCPAPASECLAAGVCDPFTGACSYAPKPPGTACGDPSDTVCDNPDTCGAAGECVVNHEAVTTLCRGDAGECDVPEFCSALGLCPMNGFEPAGTLCRASTDACDPLEACSGIAAACPADVRAVCTLCGDEFYDANANAAYDPEELGIAGWQLTLAGGGELRGASSDAGGGFAFTDLAEGDYTLCEAMPEEPSWLQTAPPEVCYAVHVPSVEAEICALDFGNVCLGAGGGHTIGFWSNKNGREELQAADGGASALALLVSLELRSEDGSAFDPASHGELRSWLLGARSVNMAYMLSAQLAAMELSVLRGFVGPDALVFAPGSTTANELGFATVSAVLAESNAELALHGYTPAGSEHRAHQKLLASALAGASTDLGFVQPEACAATFPAGG